MTVEPYAGAALGRTTKTIVLVGDSVPQRLAPELSAAAAAHGYVVISATRGSCPASGVGLVDSRGKPWGPGTQCATDVPARQDEAVARYRPALVIWWSRYELADRVDARGRPVRFGSRAYWALQRQAFVRRTTALTAKGAVVVAVEIERSGVGMRPAAMRRAVAPSSPASSTRWARRASGMRSSLRTGQGSVRAIDIQPLVCRDAASPCNDRLPDGTPARPDGTHYGPVRGALDRARRDRSSAGRSSSARVLAPHYRPGAPSRRRD